MFKFTSRRSYMLYTDCNKWNLLLCWWTESSWPVTDCLYSHHMYHDLTVPVYTHINGVCVLTLHVLWPHRACLYTHQWGMCTHTTCIMTSPCLSIHTSMGYVYSRHMYHDLTVPVYTHINGVCLLTPHVSWPHRACLYTHQWGMSTHATCIMTSPCLSIHTSMGYVYSRHMYYDLTVPVYTHINGVCLLTPHVSWPHRACLYTHQWGMCTHTTCIMTSPCLSIHTSMGYVYSHHMYHDLTVPVYTHINGVCVLTPHVSWPHRACLYTHQWGMSTHATCIMTSPCLSIHTSMGYVYSRHMYHDLTVPVYIHINGVCLLTPHVSWPHRACLYTHQWGMCTHTTCIMTSPCLSIHTSMGYVYSHHMYHDLTVPVYTHINGVCVLTPHVSWPHRACLYTHQWGMSTHTTCIMTSPCLSIHTSMGYVYSRHMYHDLTVPVYTHINGVCLLTPHVSWPHRACLYTHQWGMCTHTTCIMTSPCLSIHTSMGYVYSRHMYHDLTVPVYTHINGVCVLTPHVSWPHRACLYTHQWGMCTHATCIMTSPCLSIHTSMGYVYSRHMYHDLTVPVYTHINGVCVLTPHVSWPHRACLYTHQWGMSTHATCIMISLCLSIHTSMGYVYSRHMYYDLTVPVYTHINGVCVLTLHVSWPHRACLYTHQWGMSTHATCIMTSPCLSIHTSMGYVYSRHMYHDLTVPVYTHINGVCVLTPHVSWPHRACLYTHQWGMCTHATCIMTSPCLSIHTSMGYVYSRHMYHDLTVPVYTHINGVCVLTPHVSWPHRACLYTHQWGMCTHATCIMTSPCLSIHTSMGYVYSRHMYHDLTVPVYTHINGVCLLTPHVSWPHRACLYTHQWGMCTHATCIVTSPCLSIHTSMGYVYSRHMYHDLTVPVYTHINGVCVLTPHVSWPHRACLYTHQWGMCTHATCIVTSPCLSIHTSMGYVYSRHMYRDLTVPVYTHINGVCVLTPHVSWPHRACLYTHQWGMCTHATCIVTSPCLSIHTSMGYVYSRHMYHDLTVPVYTHINGVCVLTPHVSWPHRACLYTHQWGMCTHATCIVTSPCLSIHTSMGYVYSRHMYRDLTVPVYAHINGVCVLTPHVSWPHRACLYTHQWGMCTHATCIVTSPCLSMHTSMGYVYSRHMYHDLTVPVYTHINGVCVLTPHVSWPHRACLYTHQWGMSTHTTCIMTSPCLSIHTSMGYVYSRHMYHDLTVPVYTHINGVCLLTSRESILWRIRVLERRNLPLQISYLSHFVLILK